MEEVPVRKLSDSCESKAALVDMKRGINPEVGLKVEEDEDETNGRRKLRNQSDEMGMFGC